MWNVPCAVVFLEFEGAGSSSNTINRPLQLEVSQPTVTSLNTYVPTMYIALTVHHHLFSSENKQSSAPRNPEGTISDQRGSRDFKTLAVMDVHRWQTWSATRRAVTPGSAYLAPPFMFPGIRETPPFC